MSTPANKHGRRPGAARSGLDLLKKLVYENYQPEPEDLRDAPRRSVVGEVTVTMLDAAGSPVGTTRAFIRDVSEHGCGLWSRVAMPVGAGIMVSSPGPAGGRSAERLARVQHCRGAAGTGFAIGIRFESDEPVRRVG